MGSFVPSARVTGWKFWPGGKIFWLIAWREGLDIVGCLEVDCMEWCCMGSCGCGRSGWLRREKEEEEDIIHLRPRTHLITKTSGTSPAPTCLAIWFHYEFL